MRQLRRCWALVLLLALTPGCLNDPVGSTAPAAPPAEESADDRGSATSPTVDGTAADGTATPPSETDDAGLRSVDARLHTFDRLAAATGLDERLRRQGPATVFAPTDEAWAELAATSPRLTKDERLRILRYHVVPGSVARDDLVAGQRLRTRHGDPLTVNVTDDAVFVIDGTGLPATVIAGDLTAGELTVHVIDRVLLPDVDQRARVGHAPDGGDPYAGPSVGALPVTPTPRR